MPYKDRDKHRERARWWKATHPERVREHRRRELLAKARKNDRLPSKRAIEQHGFTADDELRPLLQRVLAAYGGVSEKNTCSTRGVLCAPS